MRYRFLPIGLGLLGGFLVISLIQWIGSLVNPLPEGIDPSDIAAVETFMREEAPAGMFMGVLLAHVLGVFVAGFVAAWFEKLQPRRMRAALIAGIILMVFGLINLFMLPHPIWFWISSLLLYIPLAWLGGMVGMSLKKAE